jgi:protein-tyrosine phosphatase
MGDIHGVGGPARRALMLRAATTSVLLSVLFLIVYGSTNWLTAQRPDAHVKTWYFAWEPAAIPYVPLLIVPYMSIDLFFFFAAFLCRDGRELRVLAQRVVFSILVAGGFFLLLPLKLAWPARPGLDGWFGDLVEASCTAPFLMEYPHNLFPTLHIALCLILADIYARHTAGLVRILSNTWFTLIGLSTVLTWQHHLIDVVGGLVLAAFAFHLFRGPGSRLPVVPNARVGCCYAAGATVLLALTPVVWPWGTFLFWPAAAFGMVAAAYFGRGPGMFHKAEGLLPLSTRFVLAPVLIGHYLSLLYYRRQCRPWDEVASGVLIGRALTEAEATAALKQGVSAVLDLTAELPEATPFRASRYSNLPILDLTAPTQDQLQEAVALIAAEAAKGVVYVHCKIGYSRSAAVVGAYLLARHEATSVEDAVARLRQVRPSIIIRPEALEALHLFAERSRSGVFV